MPPVTLGFGDPIGGGYYAGMIWNQLGQTNTASLLSAGSKAFIVPAGSLTGVTYMGQMLEIRSRANPNNHFKCTVVSSSPSSLTVSVDSISGSGTFSDWSIMGRYRVIVAPKALGENHSIAVSSGALLPDGSITLSEGWLSTVAMVNAGSSADYPAAHWARGLSINGYSDWYVPSRDELELSWRNLKPVSSGNYDVGSSRYSVNIATLGSYGDAQVSVSNQGTNINSYPAGAGYTAENPAQTLSAAFQVNGVNSYQSTVSSNYLTSSRNTGADMLCYQEFDTQYPGYQGRFPITTTGLVRAVRRLLV